MKRNTAIVMLACVVTPGIGCSPTPSSLPSSDQRDRLLSALRMLPSNPVRAMETCRSLSPPWMAECTLATVDSAPGHRSAPDWCGLISSGVLQDECFFQIAEHTKNPSSCVQAGVFRDDCRLHLWTKQTHTFFVDDRPWNAWVDDIAQAMRDQEIDPKDMRFWSAAFRRPLRPPPMDRRGCLAITNEQIRQACWHTGARVYEDWLNHERDFSALECGVEPPPRLRPIDDPELAGQLNARWGKDLCPRVDSRQ